MDQKQLKNLIKKYQEGSANSAEKFIVEHWYESLGQQNDQATENILIPDRQDLKKRIIGLARESEKNRSRGLRRFSYIAAASILLMMLSSIFYYQYFAESRLEHLIKPIQQVHFNKGTISTGIAERKTVVLNDGTKVILNANSSLTVGDYNRVRDVKLHGEAYFDVKKDPSKPFSVHAGGLHIKVLGTSFNVSAYPDITHTAVSVHTGKVQVNNNEKNLRTLLPDEQISYDRQSTDFKLTNEAYAFETSWLSDHVKLDRASFEELSQNFKNFYGYSLYTADEKLLKDSYNISFRQSKTMSTAIDEIKLLTGKQIRIKNKQDGKEIVLY